jgi:chromosome segregation ATPase
LVDRGAQEARIAELAAMREEEQGLRVEVESMRDKVEEMKKKQEALRGNLVAVGEEHSDTKAATDALLAESRQWYAKLELIARLTATLEPYHKELEAELDELRTHLAGTFSDSKG